MKKMILKTPPDNLGGYSDDTTLVECPNCECGAIHGDVHTAAAAAFTRRKAGEWECRSCGETVLAGILASICAGILIYLILFFPDSSFSVENSVLYYGDVLIT